MNSPRQRYQADLVAAKLRYDPAQAAALEVLEAHYEALTALPERQRFSRFLGRRVCKSLYLWGPVGRGKTCLMDYFYAALPFAQKRRLHFYHFMQDVHRRLADLEGHADPLKILAKDLAKEIRVLCLDEFFVSDIGDAMILARLLEALFNEGLSVITTSNVEPQYLYRDGLQRERFLAAIELIYSHMDVLAMQGAEDHRLHQGVHQAIYYWPLDQAANAALEKSFAADTSSGGMDAEVSEPCVLNINKRPLRALKVAGDCAWFEFSELCQGPRSYLDYIVLAQRFRCIYVTGVVQMGGQMHERIVARGTEDNSLVNTLKPNHRVANRAFVQALGDDEARRFIALVDEFYDQGLKLCLSAQVSLDKLYLGGRVAMEFERTRSRLIEMASEPYLSARSPAP